MTVLQVLNNFLPQQAAGTEVYSWALSKELQQTGIDVHIIIPHYGKNVDADYIYDGLRVKQYAEPSILNRSLIMGFRPADGLKYFISYLNQVKPDIVHFHELAGSNGITLQHVKAAKASGAKVFFTFHLANYTCKTGTLFYKGKSLCNGKVKLNNCSRCYLYTKGYINTSSSITFISSILNYLSLDTSKWSNRIGTALGMVPLIAKQANDLHKLVNSCDRVIVIANWYQRILLEQGIDKTKISFIPQGLPLKTNFQPKKNRSLNQAIHLVFLGRINKFKGLHLLIEALSGIEPSLVNLSIYGNSDDLVYENILRAKTKKMINVSWNGKLSQENVVLTLHKHDMLCLCSTFSEMSPLVIQEAFAARIPVLASNVYGNAEQIKHEFNGLLFQFNNIEDLRNQIIRCINEPKLVETLTKNITCPRSFEDVAKDYYKLYQRILN